MNQHGDALTAFIEARIKKLDEVSKKGITEFDTIWALAVAEGGKRELRQLLIDLEKL
jgi:hypothetical protein